MKNHEKDREIMKFQIKRRRNSISDQLKKIREMSEAVEVKELSEEEIAEVEKANKEFEKSFSSLRLARKNLFHRSEEEAVYVYTYNRVIEAKMMLRNQLNSRHKFRKTNYLKQVSSFSN